MDCILAAATPQQKASGGEVTRNQTVAWIEADSIDGDAVATEDGSYEVFRDFLDGPHCELFAGYSDGPPVDTIGTSEGQAIERAYRQAFTETAQAFADDHDDLPTNADLMDERLAARLSGDSIAMAKVRGRMHANQEACECGSLLELKAWAMQCTEWAAKPCTEVIPAPAARDGDPFYVPGFIASVMDHTLKTAPYPNVPLAFCGALALQSVLAARKVRDSNDNRSNVMILALASSAVGKDQPRKTNTKVLLGAGLSDCLGSRFASGEGIQDRLYATPSMLYQVDEFDGMLQSMAKSKDARYESVMTALLEMFSSSNSFFPMRCKAGGKSLGAIDQPSLTILGTAIPTYFFSALSTRMLCNGLFSRMIVVEAGPRASGQDAPVCDLPPDVVDTAKWWAEFRPGTGDLQDFHPVPKVVPYTDAAKRLMAEVRTQFDGEHSKADKTNDEVARTAWGRAAEQARKLALLYAVSENHVNPQIGVAAVMWASRFMHRQVQWMLDQAKALAGDDPFESACQRVLQKLQDAPDKRLAHSALLKRIKLDAKTFASVINTLEQRGDIQVEATPRPGWAGRFYKIHPSFTP